MGVWNEFILSNANEVDITSRPLDMFLLPFLMKLSTESYKFNFSAFNTFTVGGNAHTSGSVGGGECSGNGDTGTAPNIKWWLYRG